jgi:hypothetical protein
MKAQTDVNALNLLPTLEVAVKVRNLWLFRLRLCIGLCLIKLAGRCLGGIDRLTVDGQET